MDTTTKKPRRRTTAKGAAAAAAATTVVEKVEMIDPFIDFKGSLEVLVRNLERTVKQQQQQQPQQQEQSEELLMMAQQMEEMETRHEAHVSELQNAFQVQESESNGAFIKTIEGLELALEKEQETFKQRVEEEIKSYMDVSLLNQYIKQIDTLKKDNDILTLKLNAKIKVLEKIQREHKELQLDMEVLSLRSEAAEADADVEEAAEADADVQEAAEAAEADADVEEADADAEEAEAEADVQEADADAEEAEAGAEAEADVEEADADVQEAEADVEEAEAEADSKEVVEVEVEVEIDVSKLDIIEVDDVEYYLDLDNNILDKNTLDILGTLTSEGDALFN